MDFAALIVAAGKGVRAGGGMPKQYRDLRGQAVLARTIAAFLDHPFCRAVQVVIGPEDRALYDAATASLHPARLLPPVTGGDTRSASVRRGLAALSTMEPPAVLIHDAARPFLGHAVIDRVLGGIGPGHAAFPALPIVDALWRAEHGQVTAPHPRENLWRAQTPQGFLYRDIVAAHDAAQGPADDDVAIARAAGLAVSVVLGDGNNFKITLPQDFDRAERLLREEMDIRTGNGFDVHAFAPGDQVILNGVRIPFDKALSGHSDADVGMHALTDAIFGALAEGDIGQWFPPSDPQWKGAASHIFLEKAVERATARGFRITSLDCTLICEAPKIGPHAAAMRESLSRITGVEVERISVKATTTERLGFPGRGEGIAALATATLVGA
ncbi:bifunctional 2-C-methyl-D-erythritol 4-phosphate cytidylyltransferase/2-C-methyl-D-erythritol 2,4-cyclodiphosphate synthase [Halovulum dunhuangense]|uniref:Bifunctional enzyme IspD/IspF n=1 Tax=Halovulum dunhuangense TaxID=1505036 RepID=A0A849L331_9RHOB|nr:bifunctional 2-C-methyl-D-erythritol 4-phosphate cytidylyltransferase/2-C-methyl-D-erythritol 2,4-cyclodiphosphate synthase [Halovulum dunhuangense]NNU80640.1 bifunctional 2-C-methyl-D-erythritol 4-phosphate cytidylyltransferase/2-C-methyl-D-erythritol 2,4-cyclodiphosphate synthase [Halovulum dunhuangense]